MSVIFQVSGGYVNPITIGQELNSPHVLSVVDTVDPAETITVEFANGVQNTVPVGILDKAPALVIKVIGMSAGVTDADVYLGKL